MGVFKQVLVVLSSLTALIQTATARREGCGPQPRGVWRGRRRRPPHSATAESVCIGANCFFFFLITDTEENAARRRLFGDDSHRELLSIMSHKLQTAREEGGRIRRGATLCYSRRTGTFHYSRITDSTLTRVFYSPCLGLNRADSHDSQ